MFEFKILLGVLILFVLETLNGMFRIKVLPKYISKKRIKIVSFLIGLLIIILFTYLYLPLINPNSYKETFIIGAYWSLLMILFDIFVGKVLFKLHWSKILDDFNIKKGNLLSIGILFIFIIPSVLYFLSVS